MKNKMHRKRRDKVVKKNRCEIGVLVKPLNPVCVGYIQTPMFKEIDSKNVAKIHYASNPHSSGSGHFPSVTVIKVT